VCWNRSVVSFIVECSNERGAGFPILGCVFLLDEKTNTKTSPVHPAQCVDVVARCGRLLKESQTTWLWFPKHKHTHTHITVYLVTFLDENIRLLFSEGVDYIFHRKE
jgi:hypothetical protein